MFLDEDRKRQAGHLLSLDPLRLKPPQGLLCPRQPMLDGTRKYGLWGLSPLGEVLG